MLEHFLMNKIPELIGAMNAIFTRSRKGGEGGGGLKNYEGGEKQGVGEGQR